MADEDRNEEGPICSHTVCDNPAVCRGSHWRTGTVIFACEDHRDWAVEVNGPNATLFHVK